MSDEELLAKRQIVVDALARLPIFPLPSSVLIPGGHLPLHIFEPRYRRMIADALAGDRVLGVALLSPGWEGSYHGRPPIAEHLGVGYIQQAEELPDGRFNIFLHGVVRARVVRELDTPEPYRSIEAALVPDTLDKDPETLLASARSLRQLVVDLAAVLPDNAATPLADACVREEDPGRLADQVGAAVLVDHRLRQQFLEETRVSRRLDWVSEAVAQVLLQVSRGSGGGYLM